MSHVFILAKDGGCEGFSPPIQAFTHEHEARAALATLGLVGYGWKLFCVPVWPEPVEGQWFNIKPI